METLQTLCSELIERWDNAPTPSDFMDFGGYGVIDKIRAALAQSKPGVMGELTDQELLRCAHIATPCYDLKSWERELQMMRAAIAADRARRPAPAAEGEVGRWDAELEEHLAVEWPSLTMAASPPAPVAEGEVAELALKELERTVLLLMPVTGHKKIKRFNTIRAALKRLQELENKADLSPAPVAEGEVRELVAWLRETGDLIQPSHLAEHQRYKRAADLLERQAAPLPVPVGERLEQLEDLAADAVGALRYIAQSQRQVLRALLTAEANRAERREVQP